MSEPIYYGGRKKTPEGPARVLDFYPSLKTGESFRFALDGRSDKLESPTARGCKLELDTLAERLRGERLEITVIEAPHTIFGCKIIENAFPCEQIRRVKVDSVNARNWRQKLARVKAL